MWRICRKVSGVTPISYKRINICDRNISLKKSDDAVIHEVKAFEVEKTPITALLWSQRQMSTGTDDSSNTTTIHQSIHTYPPCIQEKDSKDSRVTVEYNFSTDANLRDRYMNSHGNCLMGKLFEDLDALAGTIAFRHCHNNNPNSRGLHYVTASVDKIIKQNQIPAKEDLILTGQVAWVGKSSLDIIMEIHNADLIKKYNDNKTPILIDNEGNNSRLLSSFFTFVAKDTQTGKPASINKFIPNTSAEENLFKIRENLAIQRKNNRTELHQHMNSHSPIERNLMTALIERGMSLEDMPALAHPNAVLMKRTILENSLIIPPQNVNTSGRVFGGFLMHRAFDLALATCYNFSGVKPYFKEVDKIIFKKPVDIGDLVRFKSRVVYASDDPVNPIAQVEVTCQVMRPERASSFISNTFNFIFGFPDGATLRRVLPTTYEEAIVL
eukprot:gene13117-27703_t